MNKRAIIIGIILICGFVLIHEVTHVAVAHNFNCDYETGGFKFNGFMSAFYVETSCPVSSVEMQAAYNMAQSNVDAIGYQTGMLLVIGLILFVFATGDR